jgi:hypothetical protein
MLAPLEACVVDMALIAVDSPALSAEVRRQERTVGDASEFASLRADEAALEQLARDHYVERVIGRSEYLAARDALTERIKAARTRIDQDANRSVLADVTGDNVRALWDAGDFDWRRRFLTSVIDHVSIGPGKPGATRFDPERVEVAWRD